MRPPAPRGQALVVGVVLILVAMIPLAWALTGAVFGVGLPFGGPALVAVRLGLLLTGLLGLAVGVRLVQGTLLDER